MLTRTPETDLDRLVESLRGGARLTRDNDGSVLVAAAQQPPPFDVEKLRSGLTSRNLRVEKRPQVPGKREEEYRPLRRGTFTVHFLVDLNTEQGWQSVDAATVFSGGQETRFRIRSATTGYVYLLDETPLGEQNRIYPDSESTARRMRTCREVHRFNQEVTAQILTCFRERAVRHRPLPSRNRTRNVRIRTTAAIRIRFFTSRLVTGTTGFRYGSAPMHGGDEGKLQRPFEALAHHSTAGEASTT